MAASLGNRGGNGSPRLPRLIVTAGAARELERCRRFLAGKNKRAAARAGEAIERQFALLEASPEIGRPHPDLPELRELIIGFGESGYVALYRHESDEDAVFVLAFQHQREAGY
jgi:plasmid stabilization system protein ParE